MMSCGSRVSLTATLSVLLSSCNFTTLFTAGFLLQPTPSVRERSAQPHLELRIGKVPFDDHENSHTLEKDSKNNEVLSDDFMKEGINNFMPDVDVCGRIVGPDQVHIYDTSLRDGTQGESVSVSCDDKIKIAVRLANFNINFIEAGWPGSNPKDAEFFRRAQTELPPEVRSKLVAFGSTRRKSVSAKDDGQIQALINSGAPTVCIVAKSHKWQVTDIIRATPEENLEMIMDSVSHLVSVGRRVYVDLEHFFDGYEFDRDYAMECCEAATNAGASGLVLCDTNGGSMPWDIGSITKDVVKQFQTATVGIHAHNDCGMAVANSIMAAKNGAGLIQGTINGIGERTGNADLCSIIPSLALHVDSQMSCRENLSEITSLSRFVDEVINRNPNSYAPYVGVSAFAHKGGLHVAAMERSPMSYQHIDPSLVGNEKRVLVSELSGRQNILGRINSLVDLDDEVASERAVSILNRVKYLESIGYSFEGADASVDLMILHATKGYCPPFIILDYSTQVFHTSMDPALRGVNLDLDQDENTKKNGDVISRATVKVRTVNTDEAGNSPYVDKLEVSDGLGPIDALAGALKRALIPTYSVLDNVELIDYKVRILDPESATAAMTRVMIEFRNTESEETWATVGAERNVISASLNALVDGFEYVLMGHSEACVI